MKDFTPQLLLHQKKKEKKSSLNTFSDITNHKTIRQLQALTSWIIARIKICPCFLEKRNSKKTQIMEKKINWERYLTLGFPQSNRRRTILNPIPRKHKRDFLRNLSKNVVGGGGLTIGDKMMEKKKDGEITGETPIRIRHERPRSELFSFYLFSFLFFPLFLKDTSRQGGELRTAELLTLKRGLWYERKVPRSTSYAQNTSLGTWQPIIQPFSYPVAGPVAGRMGAVNA